MLILINYKKQNLFEFDKHEIIFNPACVLSLSLKIIEIIIFCDFVFSFHRFGIFQKVWLLWKVWLHRCGVAMRRALRVTSKTRRSRKRDKKRKRRGEEAGCEARARMHPEQVARRHSVICGSTRAASTTCDSLTDIVPAHNPKTPSQNFFHKTKLQEKAFKQTKKCVF